MFNRLAGKRLDFWARVAIFAIGASAQKVSDTDIAGGLKEALGKGIKSAVSLLGKDNGFLLNDRVKIPLPKSLQKLEKGLRLAGQGKAVDDFEYF